MIGSIPPVIGEAIEAHTGSIIKGFSLTGGGCINHGGKVTTSLGRVYFLKWNDLRRYADMFVAEAKGLSLLRKANALQVPEVIYVGSAGDFQYLLLEYIEEGSRGRNYWKDFGTGLALLHRNTASEFGLDHDNYIGSLPQNNRQCRSGVEFFVEQRLRIQLQVALDQNRIDRGVSKKFDTLFNKITYILSDEPSSLLHGDLWGGNLMITSKGEPCLIDPAVYYGHREADLAMTQLFGGFDTEFLNSYREQYPLAPGYEERFEIFNLYPLLVHLNLFGPEYRLQVISIVNQFV